MSCPEDFGSCRERWDQGQRPSDLPAALRKGKMATCNLRTTPTYHWDTQKPHPPTRQPHQGHASDAGSWDAMSFNTETGERSHMFLQMGEAGQRQAQAVLIDWTE